MFTSIKMFILIKRKKISVIIVFSVYFYMMSLVYLHYKNLNPMFHSSIVNDRPYLIDTEGYRLPDFDPFDPSILRYVLATPEIDCGNGKRPLTTAISNFTNSKSAARLESAILVHVEHLSDYNVGSFSCCYKAIRRNASGDPNFEVDLGISPEYDYPDAKFFVEKTCHALENRVTTVEESAVFVHCTSESILFYQNFHIFVPDVRSQEPHNNLEGNEKLNVLILGLDSVSRMNLQRYLPKTFQYLQDIKALDFKGYNKNYENTYPNMIAMLSGYYEREDEFRNFITSNRGYYDTIPFLWKNYSLAGYSTVYGEDCTYFGTFAYHRKKGFEFPPTEYYTRPYMKAAEDLLGNKGGIAWFSGCNICGGYKLNLQHILDYAEAVTVTLGKVKPYFSLLWTASLTHDRLHFAGLTDEPILALLRNMNENGYWNNTFVIFMSDHGVRYGGIRETYLGMREENLPFNFFILPKWFKEKYPRAYVNMIHNRERLTTTQDLHETLKDILNQKYKDENYLNEAHNISEFRLSHFRQIPSSRTCLNAGIPINFCSGLVAVEIPETPLVGLAAKVLLETINIGLSNFPMCHQLENYKVEKSYLVQFYEKELKTNVTYYQVQLTSFPGEAILEGIVKIEITDHSYKPKVIGEPNRLNKYSDQSYCITDPTYVKYCLCKPKV